MRVICGKSALVEGINIASRAVSSKTGLAILECCLLTVMKGDGFKLTANNMEMAIETKPIEADVLEEGAVALDSKVFFDIVRRLPGNSVEIVSDSKNLTTIRSDKSEFKILGMNAAEFPATPELDEDGVLQSRYTLPAAEFKNMIRQTIFSVSLDNSKPTLCGELLEIEGGVVKMVSLDGIRVSLRQYDLGRKDENENIIKVIIPGKTLGEISKILPAEPEATVSFSATDKHILFDLENAVVVSRLLEGEFFNYENMFLKETETKVTVDRAEFLECIERASLVSRDAKKGIKLKFEDGRIIITCNTEIGASYEEILAEQDGLGLEIGFNPRYIADVLKVLEQERVVLGFVSTSAMSPCIIKVEDSSDYQYLVLPVRL